MREHALRAWHLVREKRRREAEIRKALPPQMPAVSERQPRNEPCPCGSGKKYKRCCEGIY